MTEIDGLLCGVAGAINRYLEQKPDAKAIPILVGPEVARKLSEIIKDYYRREKDEKTDRGDNP